MRHLQYKPQKKLPFFGSLRSLHVIGEELWVVVVSNRIYVYSRDGELVRSFLCQVRMEKVIQANSGEVIVASGTSGVNIINHTGSRIKNIYTENESNFIDLSFWKGDLFAVSSEKLFIFLNKTGGWVFSRRRSNAFKITSHSDLRIFIINERLYVSFHDVYVYNMQGKLLHRHKLARNAQLCGVDREGTLLITLNTAIRGLRLYTMQGNHYSLKINYYHIEDVVIDPDDHGLWTIKSMYQRDRRHSRESLVKFIAI